MSKEKKQLPKLTFSWALADISDRSGATIGIGRRIISRQADEGRCFEIIGRILKKCDPDGKKAMARLRRSYSR